VNQALPVAAPLTADPRARALIRAGMATLALLLLIAVLWASTAPLTGAVVADGYLRTDTIRKAVQHRDGGIVEKVHVVDGARVKEGDLLVTLASAETLAGFDTVQAQLDLEQARAARLKAESGQQPSLPAGKAAGGSVAQQQERQLFDARQQFQQQQSQALQRQISDLGGRIAALEGSVKAAAETVKLAQEEVSSNESLRDGGFVSEARLLSLRKAAADARTRHTSLQAELAEARQQKGALAQQLSQLQDGFRRDVAGDYAASLQRLNELSLKQRALAEQVQRLTIRAPAAGTVIDLKPMGQGAVIAPGQLLMNIVPDDSPLVVEGRVRPEDISHVKPGDKAEVRVTAFAERNSPLLSAVVTHVSADRVVEPGGNVPPYYVVWLKPEGPTTLPLKSGMSAEVFLLTPSRTLLDYWLAPFTQGMRRAAREP
jgi:HlyD family type I secretion membrane fusion protein